MSRAVLSGSDSGRIGLLRGLVRIAELAPAQRGLLIWGGIIGSFLIVPITVIAAVRAPHFSPFSDTVSDLAAQDAPHANFMRTGLIVFGLCVIGFAAGLGQSVPRLGTHLWLSLSLFGTCLVLVGVFQDYSELPGVGRNWEGYLHNLFGLAAIGSLVLSLVIACVISSRSAPWHKLLHLTVATLFVIVFSGATFMWGPEQYEGLAELILYSAALVWLVASSHVGLSNPGPPAASNRAQQQPEPAEQSLRTHNIP